MFYGLGAFLEAIASMEFDYVASGHYAHVVHSSSEDGPSILKLSKDLVPCSNFFFLHLYTFVFEHLYDSMASVDYLDHWINMSLVY